MTAAEIVMKRDDPNIAWGFRLTGGADLGTPFYVVKVLGRGHAERAGLQVGDMVYAINNKYINKFTHKDAQNVILHTGDTLTLNIRRGSPIRRGTPLPEYADPLMGLVPAPPTPRQTPVPPPPYEPPLVIKEPTPPESEEEEEGEETVAAFNVKINPKGRIAAIEELPVTPPPSRSSSRCRSRSRSMSMPRDRRRSSSMKQESSNNQQKQVENGFSGTSGPGETFTYSKEVLTQYSTVLSASNQTAGHMSENINESFIIHGGSERKMEDVLCPEDIERDIFEEKMEEQKITELLTGEAELLDKGVVGINFQKIIPKTDFIKESNVFKELQGQCLKKEESEEEQLRKDPNKRFSTFLQTPKRPIPKPKPKPNEDLQSESTQPESQLPTSQTLQQEQTLHSSTSVNIVEEVTFQESSEYDSRMLMVQGDPVITEAVSTDSVYDEKVRFQEEEKAKYNIEEYTEEASLKEEDVESVTKSQETSIQGENVESVSDTQSQKVEESSTKVYNSEFERQLAEIQKRMEAIQELPSLLQANLAALQEQLALVVQAKTAAEQKQISPEEEKRSDETEETKRDEEAKESSQNEQTQEPLQDEQSQELLQDGQTQESILEPAMLSEEDLVYSYGIDPDDSEVQQTMENAIKEQYENFKNQSHYYQRDDDEVSVAKPPMIRNFPVAVAERPIVLPGGRKWYKPKDAYNEGFIAETIINQSEVLVGSTMGVNFRKYEPPKFDAANSSVFRMVQELEGRFYNDEPRQPIELRPEKVYAGEDFHKPINKRHFFAARLAEQSNEHIEKILKDTNEQDIIAV